MSKDSREERERLKEEYKEHYRKIRDVKERLSRSRKTQNISEALKNMDTSQLMDSFDDFLFNVKSKLATVEARLDVAMDNLMTDDESFVASQQRDEELQKQQAKETLRQVKLEMGLLYKEIEEQADAIRVKKTIGTEEDEASPGNMAQKDNTERSQGQ